MNSKYAIAATIAAVLAVATSANAKSFEIGAGATYWYSIDEARDRSFDRDGLGYSLSCEIYLTDYFAVALEVERTPEDFVFLEEELYLPAVYAIVGDGVYLGLGAGAYYYDNEFYDDYWYAIRGGFKIPFFGGGLVLDININYRSENWDGIKEVKEKVGSDTLMAGAALRLAF
jgi:hypothetical protein